MDNENRMEKFYRFMTAHRRQVVFVLELLVIAVMVVIIHRFDPPFLATILLTVLFVVPMIVGVAMCSVKLQDRATKIMVDRCDPYPFLQEMQIQLSYRNLPLQDTMLRINLAMALYNTGSTRVALNVMRNIPIDKKGSSNPALQGIYYNNLAAFLNHTGDHDGAEEAWAKFSELANGRMKKVFDKHYPIMVIMADADHLYRTGEYSAALEKARMAAPKTAMDRVECAYFRAKCAVAMGDTDTARRELNDVIAHGNKLALVDTARELLRSLDCEDT